MDELELLKKDWNKDTAEFKNYSDTDIYPMLHKKSSSIVKTLFIISMAELAFWILINFLPLVLSDKLKSKLEELSHSWLYIGLNILNYAVIFLFIFLLWKAHKAISTTDNVKKLMKSILKTRKIIKSYVIFTLSFGLVSFFIGLYYSINEHPELAEQLSNANSTQLIVMSLIVIGSAAAFLLAFWFFYKLIYGILIKRLTNNYNELKKLEV